MANSFSFVLDESNVYIWPLRTACSQHVTKQFERILTPDEMNRAERFQFSHHRQSYTVVRGALKFLIAGYIGASPAFVRLEYGKRGKPSIREHFGLNFNTSHSGGLAVFAFALNSEIGIDLELIRPLPDMCDLATRFFCREETEELMDVPADQRERAFFLCWTRKEAYIKAVGDGLYLALDSFRVTLHPDAPVAFVHLDHDRFAARAWSLHNVNVAPGYAAAVAYHSPTRIINLQPMLDPALLLEL